MEKYIISHIISKAKYDNRSKWPYRQFIMRLPFLKKHKSIREDLNGIREKGTSKLTVSLITLPPTILFYTDKFANKSRKSIIVFCKETVDMSWVLNRLIFIQK